MMMKNTHDQQVKLTIVGSAMQKIDLRELTCQYPSHTRPGAK